jgi:SAM-dependent methyltransferase
MYEFEDHYWWYCGLHELVLHYVGVHLESSSLTKLKLFDAGCGTGRLAELLSTYGKVDGMDYSSEAVEFCKQRGLSNVTQGDLNSWIPQSQSYDIIISNDVVNCSDIEDDLKILERFYMGLKSGGIMILNLPAFKILRRGHDRLVYGKRRYRKREFVTQLKEIGFSPIRASYRLPHLFFFVLFKKYVVERFIHDRAETDLKPLPVWTNSLLLRMNRLENKLITLGIQMPLGSSLFVVCEKRNQQ